MEKLAGKSGQTRTTLLGLALIAVLAGVYWYWVWPWQCLAAGRSAYAEKQWALAERKLTTYVNRHPGDNEVRMQIAEAQAEQGRLREALEELGRIPDSGELGARARWHEASLLLQMNYAARAEQAARRGLELDSKSLDARQLLSLICRWEGRTAEAEQLLWELYEICPPPQRVTALMQLFELHYGEYSLPETARRLEAFIDSDARDLQARIALARMHVGAGEHDRAIEMLEACWRQKPGDPEVRAALVKCHLASAAYDRADRLLETWPEQQRNEEYYEYLGTYQMDHLQDFALAAESFRKVLAVAPDDWRGRHRLGICLQAVGTAQEAREQLEAADRTRAALDQEKIQKLLTNLFSSVRTVEGRYELGKLYEDVGRLREAKGWYGLALDLDSNHADSRKAIARLGGGAPGESREL